MGILGPDKSEIDAAKKAITREVLIRYARNEPPLKVPDRPDYQRAKAELEREDGIVSFDLDAATVQANAALAGEPSRAVKDVFVIAGILMDALSMTTYLPLELAANGLNQEQEFRPQTVRRAVTLLREYKLVALRDGKLHDLTGGNLRPKNRADRAYQPPADPDLSIAAARAAKAEAERQAAIAAAKAEADRKKKAAEAARAAEAERKRKAAEAAARAEADRIAAEAEARLTKHADWLLNFIKTAPEPTLTAAKAAASTADLDGELVQPAFEKLYSEKRAKVDPYGKMAVISEPTPEKVVKTETPAKTPVVTAEVSVLTTETKPATPTVDPAALKAVRAEVAATKQIATDTQAAVFKIGDRIFAADQELTYAEEKLRAAPVEVVKTLRRLLVLLEVKGVTVARDLKRGGLSQMQMAHLDEARDLGVLIGAVAVFDRELSLADPYKVFRDRSRFHRLVDAQKQRDAEREDNPAPQRRQSGRRKVA